MSRLIRIREDVMDNEDYYKGTDTIYLLLTVDRLEKALREAKTALDDQYRRDGGIIQNNKAYMAIFNALEGF